MSKITKKITQEVQLDLSWKQEFEKYWDNNFPEGDQNIYLICGNQDSSNRESALYIGYTFDNKYKNWKEVGEYILQNDFSWEIVDCEYEEEDSNFLEKVQNLSSPKEALYLVMETTGFDPCLLVREYDPFFNWMKNVRYWF